MSNRELDMVSLYKQGKTLQEIGDIYGFTREYIRQLIKRHDVTGKDGGRAIRMKKIRSKPCKASDCEKLATRSHGYCESHDHVIKKYGTLKPRYKNKFQVHGDDCLVEGCNKPFKANGLCSTHNMGFFYNRRDGNVTDLNDYLKVQKAKQMMGKSYALFSEIREFMKSKSI